MVENHLARVSLHIIDTINFFTREVWISVEGRDRYKFNTRDVGPGKILLEVLLRHSDLENEWKNIPEWRVGSFLFASDDDDGTNISSIEGYWKLDDEDNWVLIRQPPSVYSGWDTIVRTVSDFYSRSATLPDIPVEQSVETSSMTAEQIQSQGVVAGLNQSRISDGVPATTPHPDDTVKRYGTNGDMTKADVREIVRQCIEFQKKGGSVRSFYEDVLKEDRTKNEDGTEPPARFTLETLRSWLKNPDLRPK